MFDTQTIPPATVPAARHASRAQERLALLKSRTAEVAPADALAMQAHGAALIDVRDPDEIAQGTAAGAIRLGRSFLELRIEEAVDLGRTVIVMCGSGVRSLFAADELPRLGYADVHSLAGGFTRWEHEGLPIEMPPILDADARLRYSRHLLIPEIGEAGQGEVDAFKGASRRRWRTGSPAAYYLAAAGIGTLGLVDDDVVERSNLQRQILHTDARVGVPKVVSARLALEALNPGVKVVGHEVRLTSANIERILLGYEVVVDGSDNFATRYLVNDASRQAGAAECARRSASASTVRSPYSGRRYPTRPGPCYRCMFQLSRRRPGVAPSCAEAGALRVLAWRHWTAASHRNHQAVAGAGRAAGRPAFFTSTRCAPASASCDYSAMSGCPVAAPVVHSLATSTTSASAPARVRDDTVRT